MEVQTLAQLRFCDAHVPRDVGSKTWNFTAGKAVGRKRKALPVADVVGSIRAAEQVGKGHADREMEAFGSCDSILLDHVMQSRFVFVTNIL